MSQNVPISIFILTTSFFLSNDANRLKLIHLFLSDERQVSVVHDLQMRTDLDVLGIEKSHQGGLRIACVARQTDLIELGARNITFQVISDDINKALNRELITHYCNTDTISYSRSLTFDRYATYSEILKYFDYITTEGNGYRNVSVVSIGKTYRKRPIRMVKIEHASADGMIIMEAGAHAREWITIMAALYLISEIVHASEGSIFSRFDWYVVPCLNADGYVYSFTKNKRLHRKNLNFSRCNPNKCSCGVDLNRNFGFKWGLSGSSTDRCSQIYRGERRFSEPESQALARVLDKHARNTKLYISIHSYYNYLFYPWHYIEKNCPDWRHLKKAGQVMTDAMNRFNPLYRFYVGNGASSICGSYDYAKGVSAIKYSYILEMPSYGSTGFQPPPKMIKVFGRQFVAGLEAMAVYLNSTYGSETINKASRERSQTVLVCIISFVIIIESCNRSSGFDD